MRLSTKRKNINNRKRRKENPNRYKEYDLRKYYGMGFREYKKMSIEQKHRCKICKKKEKAVLNGKVKRLGVDHCHKTGRIRGLLCGRCNIGISMFKEDPKVLKLAIKYIEKFS